MAQNVDGIACDFVRGEPNPLRTRIQAWQLPGRSGYGSMRLGQGDAPFEFQIVKIDAAANVDTWFSQIESSVGSYATVENDWGVATTLCLILEAQRVSKIPITTSTKSGATAIGTMRISGVVGS